MSDDLVESLLLDAMASLAEPALLCTADGSIRGVNEAAINVGIVSHTDVASVHDVILGGTKTWADLMAAADRDAFVEVPTTTAILCGWRVTHRTGDIGSLYLVVAELVGADLVAAGRRLQKVDRKKSGSTSDVSSESDSVSDVHVDVIRRKISTSSKLGRSFTPALDAAASADASVHRTQSPSHSSSMESLGRAPSPTANRASSTSSSSPPSSHSPPSTSPTPSALPVPRQRSWVDRVRRSSKTNSTNLVVDLAHSEITISAVLHSGPMATITRASVCGAEVAVKTVPTRYLGAAERNEIVAVVGLASTLLHPNLLRQLGYNLESTSEFVTFFELCDTTLNKLWTSTTDAAIYTAPVALAKQAHQVALALQYLHGKSVMHRDVKASNVMVRFVVRDVMTGVRDTIMKLGDFGEMAMVVPGATFKTNVGTPEFMAPEVVAVDSAITTRAYDQQCDMWSFGMLLYEALTGGQVPYADVDRWELAKTIAAGTRPALAGDSMDDVKLKLFHVFLDCTTLELKGRAKASSVVTRLGPEFLI